MCVYGYLQIYTHTVYMYTYMYVHICTYIHVQVVKMELMQTVRICVNVYLCT